MTLLLPEFIQPMPSQIADTLANRQWLKVTARLILDGASLEAHNAIVRGYAAQQSQQITLDVYLATEVQAEKIRKFVEAHEPDRIKLINSYLAAYPARIKQAKKELKDLFDIRFYPTKEQLRHQFVFDIKYLKL